MGRASFVHYASAFALALQGVSPAHAAALTGNELYSICSDSGVNWNSGECFGYIMGVAEENDFAVMVNKIPPYICVRPQVTKGQILDIVKAYLSDHPAGRDMAASILIVLALKKAFPCEQK